MDRLTTELGEATAMQMLMGTLFWLATAALVLFPVIAEARYAANHNETLVRDNG